MRLAIVGSRSFTDYNLFSTYIHHYFCDSGDPDSFNYEGPIPRFNEIVSGGAIGIDSMATQWCKENKIKLVEHFPDYEKYGKDAPKVRNELIVKDADMVLAFWTGDMKSGTRNALNWAKKYRKPTMIIYV